MLVFVLQQ